MSGDTMAKITKERIGTFLQTAFNVLQENGGQLPSQTVMRLVEPKLQLTDYEKERFEKSGHVRWETPFAFYSMGCTKAGWLIKRKGIWYITPEGIDALKYPPAQFIAEMEAKYREWQKKQPISEPKSGTEDQEEPEIVPKSAYEYAIENAREEIREQINKMDAYRFQDLVAALLRGMGYYTPFVAPKGKDGGIDILAYNDPFGTKIPRIKVQVKHRESKATVQEVRQLIGLLNKEGDAGLFVSSGGFTQEALDAIVNNSKHIEKVQLDAIIDMWDEYYEKLTEEDKSILPLRKVSFLAPED